MLAMALIGIWGATDCKAVEVTLTVDEGVDRPIGLEAAQRNLAQVLTEINRAQQAKEILTTNGLPMDEFSLRSLLRLWAVTPFYCDDEEEGGLMLLALMERLRIALLQQVVIGSQFALNTQAGLETMCYPDDTAPYFSGEMVSTWRLPGIQREVRYDP